MDFDVIYQSSSAPDDNVLFDLYCPLIGLEAINLYKYLIFLTSKKHNIFKQNCFLFDDLYKNLNMNFNVYIKARKKLEAIGLLKTFQKVIDNKITFILYKNLDIENFLNNEKLNQLLKSKISDSEYNTIIYSISKFKHNEQFIDISESFSYILDENDINNIHKFNFKQLKNDLYLINNIEIDLSHNVIDVIEKNYLLYDLKYEQIYNLFDTSIKNNILDENLLLQNIDNFIKIHFKNNVIINTNINRDFNIFNKENNIDEFNSVINDYNNFKKENYYTILYKTTIDEQIQDCLNKLSSIYNLSDPVINVILDYVAYKNGNYFNINYVFKIANSLNLKLINKNPVDAILYFKNIPNQNKKKFNNKSYDAKVLDVL